MSTYEQELARTLSGIEDALQETSALLGEENTPRAGNTQLDLGVAEQRDHHDDGEPRPSTPSPRQASEGNGKDDDDSAAEREARESRDISPQQQDDQAGDETGGSARPPGDDLGRHNGSSGEEAQSVSSPTVKSSGSPRISYAGSSAGEERTEDRQPEVYSPQWSDYDEGDDDLGELPNFGNPGRPSNTGNVTRRNHNEPSENASQTQKAERLQAARIKDLERRLTDAHVELTTVLEKSDAQAREHNERMMQLLQNYQRAISAPADPVPSRFNRASSTLPPSSQLKQAMVGNDSTGAGGDPYKGNPSGGRREADNPNRGTPRGSGGPGRNPNGGGGPPDDDDNPYNHTIFDEVPESDHESDTNSIRRSKGIARRKHRGELDKMRFQANFMKEDPPFKYNGEVQVSTFKRWCREIRSWARRGCLSEHAGVELSGKYLGGRAYQFFERDVLDLKRKYSLSEFFEHLFDYLFPPDFRMQQRDRFDSFEQRELTVLDFLRRLHELADTIGDLDDRDITIAFWRRCKPYLRFELLREGLDPSDMSLITLEEAAVRHERAHMAAEEESKRSRKRTGGRENAPNPNRRPPERAQNSNPPERVQNPNPSTPNRQALSQPARPQNQRQGARRNNQGTGNTRRDPERTRRLRSEGKCFQCESRDHLLKDCPERNNMRPPLSLRSMELVSPVEARLAAMQEGHGLGLFGVGPVSTDDFPEDQTVTLDDLRGEISARLLRILYNAVPLSLDYIQPDAEHSPFSADRFTVENASCVDEGYCDTGPLGCLLLFDKHSNTEYEVSCEDLLLPNFDIIRWIHVQKSLHFDEMLRGWRARKWNGPRVPFVAKSSHNENDSDEDDSYSESGSDDPGNDNDFEDPEYDGNTDPGEWESPGDSDFEYEDLGEAISDSESLTLCKISLPASSDQSTKLERSGLRLKGIPPATVPQPLIVMIKIAGQPCRALLDTGSLGDFVSTTLVDQLKLETIELDKPITLQLAVSGSRGKVKHLAKVPFEYQGIESVRTFHVTNLDSHDVILGTPFMYEHGVVLGFNPYQVSIRSDSVLPIAGDQTWPLSLNEIKAGDDDIDSLRKELVAYAQDICKEAIETPLPPLRAINHVIPLIDETMVYAWRPSKCPEALKPLWRAKRDDYLRTGRWEFHSGTNSVPMLMLKKATKDGSLRLRTVIDTRQRNKNTRKLASPLPDIDTILRNVASHRFRSLIDGKDAYEQIRVEPRDVPKTLFTTPDGTMISQVMQIGDCNAGATYQALMNHVFGPYIGVFMDVYLDDIVIYSNSIEDHVKHVKIVIDTLRKNSFYLSAHKLQFFTDELMILGHVIDQEGIRMDPAKVDKVTNWKIPTNKALLASFVGAVGYLASGCEGIRIPMALLSKRAAASTAWQWSPTEQRAFEEVKGIVEKWRDLRRLPINYAEGAEKVNLTCDASLTGGSGVVSQGDDVSNANIVAFWSGKFSPAQQNYPVHELELLAIVESLKRFRHLLHGIHFRIFTDHKGLEWLTTQKKLSPRQARWLESIADFDFEIVYLPGDKNIVADALSRIYSDEPKGTVRAVSEYVTVEEENAPSKILLGLVTAPLYTGEAVMLSAVTRSATARKDGGAREAFPNAKKVVLKLGNRAQPLEGGSGVEIPETEPEIAENSTDEDKSVAEELLSEDPVTLPELISLGDPSTDIFNSIRNRYAEDKFFKLVLENPSAYKNFDVSNGLVLLKSNGKHTLCIPDIKIGERRVREMIISHAHSILAHLGASKTTTYLRDSVWWKGMVADVLAFCESCTTCKVSKPNNQPPYGKLETLDIPTRPWETIGVDFVGPLPESENLNGRFDMLMVIIDHLTSMVHLVPTKQTYRAKDVAEVIFDRVYKLHGMPLHIVSDRDSLFTSTFWQTLNELTGTELRMSSSYHPQSDGATERANRTVTQMLRQCVAPHQRDWVVKLPAIEFAINSARSDSTGYAPFVLNSGRLPRSMIFETNSEFPGVRIFAQKMKDAVMSAHDAIINARVKQTHQANQKRREVPFVKGDLVYLSTKNLSIPKGRARKLAPKFIGPYPILEEYKNNSFRLDIPAELKQRGVHPSFHADLLRIHVPSDDRRFPGRQLPQVVGLGRVEEWSIDRIVSHNGKGKDALFQLAYKTGDRVWLPYHEVSRLEALTQYLEVLGANSITDLPKHPPDGKDRGAGGDPSLEIAPVTLSLKGMSFIVNEELNLASHNMPPSPDFDATSVDEFLKFASRIRHGDFDRDMSTMVVPHRYLEFLVRYQHDENRKYRLPIPPGIHLNSVSDALGRKTFQYTPQAPSSAPPVVQPQIPYHTTPYNHPLGGYPGNYDGYAPYPSMHNYPPYMNTMQEASSNVVNAMTERLRAETANQYPRWRGGRGRPGGGRGGSRVGRGGSLINRISSPKNKPGEGRRARRRRARAEERDRQANEGNPENHNTNEDVEMAPEYGEEYAPQDPNAVDGTSFGEEGESSEVAEGA